MDNLVILKAEENNQINSKAKQYPVDEIINKDERIVKAWLTVEVPDLEKELIPIEEIKKSLNVWMKRGAPVQDKHSNRQIGKGLRWYEATHPSGNQGIIVEYHVFKDYSIDDEAWEEIKNGKRRGLSFGGRATEKPKMEKDEDTGVLSKVLRGIESYEISSVLNPCNPFAENIEVNFLAKSAGEKQPDIEGEIIKPKFSDEDINSIAEKLNYDGDIESLKEGINVELEHKDVTGGDLEMTAKIAIAHIKEDPEYYTKLKEVEKSTYRIISLPNVKQQVIEVEFPNGQRQVMQLSKSATEQIMKIAREDKCDVKINPTSEDVEKARHYLKPGQKAPEGAHTVHGSRGGDYYEDAPARKPQMPMGNKPAGKPQFSQEDEALSERTGGKPIPKYPWSKEEGNNYRHLETGEKYSQPQAQSSPEDKLDPASEGKWGVIIDNLRNAGFSSDDIKNSLNPKLHYLVDSQKPQGQSKPAQATSNFPPHIQSELDKLREAKDEITQSDMQGIIGSIAMKNPQLDEEEMLAYVTEARDTEMEQEERENQQRKIDDEQENQKMDPINYTINLIDNSNKTEEQIVEEVSDTYGIGYDRAQKIYNQLSRQYQRGGRGGLLSGKNKSLDSISKKFDTINKSIQMRNISKKLDGAINKVCKKRKV